MLGFLNFVVKTFPFTNIHVCICVSVSGHIDVSVGTRRSEKCIGSCGIGVTSTYELLDTGVSF